MLVPMLLAAAVGVDADGGGCCWLFQLMMMVVMEVIWWLLPAATTWTVDVEWNQRRLPNGIKRELGSPGLLGHHESVVRVTTITTRIRRIEVHRLLFARKQEQGGIKDGAVSIGKDPMNRKHRTVLCAHLSCTLGRRSDLSRRRWTLAAVRRRPSMLGPSSGPCRLQRQRHRTLLRRHLS